jgi:prolyl 4-hydroxylase
MQSWILSNYLTEDQCQKLIEMGKPQVSRSTGFNVGDGSESYSEHRTSEHTFLPKGANDLVTTVEKMVAYQTGFPIENQEGIQIAHYVPGTYFKSHHDYFDPRYKGASVTLERGGQRVVTFMIYLNTIPEGYGGETYFDKAGMSVRPDMGKACLWYNLYPNGQIDISTMHEGRTPKEPYEKWIATIWVRERTFI